MLFIDISFENISHRHRVLLHNSAQRVMEHKLNLSHKVPGIPDEAYYMKNIISEKEEDILLSAVSKSPEPCWTNLSNRRLQNVGGVPHEKGMIPVQIPDWLQTAVDLVNGMNIFPAEKQANHILLNEYLPMQGIMPHVDGSLFYPIITTLSLGSHTVLDFYSPIDKEDCEEHADGENKANQDLSLEKRRMFSFLLEPRSLLILKDEMYTKYLHGIREVKEDQITEMIKNLDLTDFEGKLGDCLQRTKRISLTIRNVPKVTKFKLKFGK